LFINEAKKLYQKEFIRWFKLTTEINPLLRFFRTKDIKIPTLYLMGSEDHLFLPSIKNIVTKHLTSSLFVVDDCGHVVNVEQPKIFNNQTIKFINSLA
jgi:pimeloyl-ACP methyl ester carboxylesterase